MFIAHIMSRRAIHFHHRFSVSNHLKEATSWAKLASLRSPQVTNCSKVIPPFLPKSWFSEKWDVSKVSCLSFRVIVHWTMILGERLNFFAMSFFFRLESAQLIYIVYTSTHFRWSTHWRAHRLGRKDQTAPRAVGNRHNSRKKWDTPIDLQKSRQPTPHVQLYIARNVDSCIFTSSPFT